MEALDDGDDDFLPDTAYDSSFRVFRLEPKARLPRAHPELGLQANVPPPTDARKTNRKSPGKLPFEVAVPGAIAEQHDAAFRQRSNMLILLRSSSRI